MKTTTQVILFTGPYGVGKSTAAEALANHLSAQQVSFATAIRLELSELTGIPFEVLAQKPTPTWLRDMLKGFGGWKRSIDDLHYAKKAVAQMNQPTVVIDDLRYVLEIKYLLDMGVDCKVIYIGEKEYSYDLVRLYENYTDHYLPEKPPLSEILAIINSKLMVS